MPTRDVARLLATIPFDMKPQHSAGNIPIRDFWGWMRSSREIIGPWWSPQRDMELDAFWRSEDHIAGAVYNMVAKMVAIPFKIVPRDTTVKRYVEQAKRYEAILLEDSGIGHGWETEYHKFITDMLTQDNGGFLLVGGEGNANGPIFGEPAGIMCLDSERCTRTGDKKYPVKYLHDDGREYALHATRVIFRSQMPSARRAMYDVGFCAISRMIHTGQHLLDIARYEQEKLGSRPLRALMIGSGITGQQIYEAIAQAEMEADNRGLENYSGIVAMGSTEKAEVDVKDMASIPDGFSKEQSVTLAMFTIALALGVDARELWPASASGATKADALIQHLKARSKGPGQIIGAVEQMFNSIYLPEHLSFVFDWIDDEQDKAQAEIRDIRSTQRDRDLANRTTDLRTNRLLMRDANDITLDMFADLELVDGRLEDGSDVLLLFDSEDRVYDEFLDLGVENVMRVTDHMGEAETILKSIQEKVEYTNKAIYNATSANDKRIAKNAVAALVKLRDMYMGIRNPVTGEPMPVMATNPDGTPATDEANATSDTAGAGSTTTANPQQDRDGDGKVGEQEKKWVLSREIQEQLGIPREKRFSLKSANSYKTAISGLASELWDGEISSQAFFLDMTDVVKRGLAEAFLNGAKSAGVNSLNEMLPEAQLVMNKEITENINAIFGFGYDIIENVKGSGDFSVIENRVGMWANTYGKMQDLGRVYAKDDIRLRWVTAKGKDSCRHCRQMDGRVYRAETWRKSGLLPKSRSLECEGYKCGCRFEVTEESLTPGVPPSL